MARATRSPAIYTADPHGPTFTNYNFVMQIPDTDIADTNRGWGTPSGGEDGLSTRMKPRHVVGVDGSGNHGRAIIADPTAGLWLGTATTFDVNGVTYTVTGYVGEKRTVNA
jgi:hypothetical protein